MTQYHYVKAGIDAGQLQGNLITAGIPVDHINVGGASADQIDIFTTRDLTPTEVAVMDGIVATTDNRPRRPRLLFDIDTALTNLTVNQLTAVWNDLLSGTPAKITQNLGGNQAAILVQRFAVANIDGLSAGNINVAKRRVVAMYCQDNPGYLVHPTFDTSINVPGDEPYTP